MTSPVFSMPFVLLDDIDRAMLARDLTAAAATWPVLAGLATAARDCADRDTLEYEIGQGVADLAGIGRALEAMYEAVRADGGAVRVALLRLLAAWTTFTASY